MLNQHQKHNKKNCCKNETQKIKKRVFWGKKKADPVKEKKAKKLKLKSDLYTLEILHERLPSR
ncbi:MAG: hypothetical protein CM1200mP28_12050 [Deltaproteobacteria bacterium]|nr:MAG: hypothetical protein CM1200mP28_12050 [Deltaproteobacteria bacterium]